MSENMKIEQTWKCGECDEPLEYGNNYPYSDSAIFSKSDKKGVVGVFACPNAKCNVALVKGYRNND